VAEIRARWAASSKTFFFLWSSNLQKPSFEALLEGFPWREIIPFRRVFRGSLL